MGVQIQLTDEEYARLHFEKFLLANEMSCAKERDGTYSYRGTQNMWVAYQVGFRHGRTSTGGTCEF